MATSKSRISRMHIVQETQNLLSLKLTTVYSIFFFFAILIEFALKFWYMPLTLYRVSYQNCISVKISFLTKVVTRGFNALASIYVLCCNEKENFVCR